MNSIFLCGYGDNVVDSR